MFDPVIYRSRVRIKRITGPFRRAFLPAEAEPIRFGAHGEVSQNPDMELRAHGEVSQNPDMELRAHRPARAG